MARIWAAYLYSRQGLAYAAVNEAAFRQELVLVGVLSFILLLLPLSLAWKGLLFFSTAQVLIVELLNSAVEAVVDRVSPEFHELAGRAKDMGSAAVFISLSITFIMWGIALIQLWQ